MTTPVRLQLSRKKGFDLRAHSRAVNGLEAVNVTRPGKWGNPFVVGKTYPVAEHVGDAPIGQALIEDTRDAVTAFRGWIEDDGIFADEAQTVLRGKNLACWCKPGDPCHADALLEIANRPVCEAVS